MVGEAGERPPEGGDDVDIGRFGGEREGEGGEAGGAVESGAAETRAGEEVGDGFHAFGYLGMSSVNASRAIERRAGRRPRCSPSASARIVWSSG